MSEEHLVGLDDILVPSVEDEAWLNAQEGAVSLNGPQPAAVRPWRAEPWSEFRDTAEEEQRWIVEGLLPEGAFAFIAAPPKKGKTWLALGLTLSIASGRPFVQEYAVREPRDALYVALEGSRSAIRARTGCLARGLGIDPDGDELEKLHVLYRPRPFDLAKPESATWLVEEQEETGADFIVVDVLRQAARFRENVAEDFAVVRDAFDPLLERQCTVVLLHHFGKLTDTQKDRSPGERMAGTGAMYGALDVGFLITQSQNGARRLRVDVEARDFATPEALGVVIEGTGTGEHGGFRYTDRAEFLLDASAAEERDLVAELEELFADEKWRTVKEASTKKTGIGANIDTVRVALDSSPERFAQVSGEFVGRKKDARMWGTIGMRSKVTQPPESPESPLWIEGSSAGEEAGDSPYGESPPESPAYSAAEGDSATSSQVDPLQEEPAF